APVTFVQEYGNRWLHSALDDISVLAAGLTSAGGYTNANGTASIPITKPGPLLIGTAVGGVGSATRRIVPENGKEYELVIAKSPPSGMLTVTDAVSGEPVQDALLNTSTALISTISDSAGLLTYWVAEALGESVVLAAPGYVPVVIPRGNLARASALRL